MNIEQLASALHISRSTIYRRARSAGFDLASCRIAANSTELTAEGVRQIAQLMGATMPDCVQHDATEGATQACSTQHDATQERDAACDIDTRTSSPEAAEASQSVSDEAQAESSAAELESLRSECAALRARCAEMAKRIEAQEETIRADRQHITELVAVTQTQAQSLAALAVRGLEQRSSGSIEISPEAVQDPDAAAVPSDGSGGRTHETIGMKLLRMLRRFRGAS